MKILLLAVLVALHATYSLQAPGEVLHVSLYYEARCPACSFFITKRLYPAYQKIGSNLQIDFVPYGNTQRSQEDGKWVYECQHGPDECAINKIQACGLAKVSNNNKQMEFVNCVETVAKSHYQDHQKIAEDCATYLDLPRNEILNCSRGPEGDDLYGKLADKQSSLATEISYVPWITLNGKHDETFQLAAFRNFLNAACDKFVTKPEGCP